MRFYGVPSEDRVIEILDDLVEGTWVFEDLKDKKREVLSTQEARLRLKEIMNQIKGWKESMATLSKTTVFVFIHEPSEPKAFKIYDTSSLGCSTSLTPPRWKVYLRELEGHV